MPAYTPLRVVRTHVAAYALAPCVRVLIHPRYACVLVRARWRLVSCARVPHARHVQAHALPACARVSPHVLACPQGVRDVYVRARVLRMRDVCAGSRSTMACMHYACVPTRHLRACAPLRADVCRVHTHALSRAPRACHAQVRCTRCVRYHVGVCMCVCVCPCVCVCVCADMCIYAYVYAHVCTHLLHLSREAEKRKKATSHAASRPAPLTACLRYSLAGESLLGLVFLAVDGGSLAHSWNHCKPKMLYFFVRLEIKTHNSLKMNEL